MRDRALFTSVARLLDDDEQLEHVVHMWTRHRYAFPFILAAGIGFFVLAMVVGIGGTANRVGLAFGGGAIAAMATTEYRILASTSRGLVLLKSSKVRRKATTLLKRLPSDIVVRPQGSNLVISDWEVGAVTYSVMRRFQQAMTMIATT